MQQVLLQSRVRAKVAAAIAGVVMGGGAVGAVAQPASAGAPCRMYTQGIPNSTSGYDIREVNNCPPLNGTFQNGRWRVQFGQWEPALYLYRGTDRRSGSSIELLDSVVSGTTDRPQYQFQNGDTIYQVTFQPSDRNTIRLEVFQNGRRVLNQLLNRTS
ncbi:MAG: hypothetical protein AAF889_14635 [Cyanobacteria bacterium P01_D01_bin.73]